MSRAWAGPSTHTSVPGSLSTPRTLPLSGPVAALVLVAGPHPSLPGPPTPASQTHFRSFPRARSCSEAGHCPCPPESLPCPLCGPSPPRSHGLLPETQTCPAFQAWFPHPSAETAWASLPAGRPRAIVLDHWELLEPWALWPQAWHSSGTGGHSKVSDGRSWCLLSRSSRVWMHETDVTLTLQSDRTVTGVCTGGAPFHLGESCDT